MTHNTKSPSPHPVWAFGVCGLPRCGRAATSSSRRSVSRTAARPWDGLFTSVAPEPALGGERGSLPAHLVRRGDGASWVLLDAWGLPASPCSSRSPRVARAFGVTRRELNLAHRRSRAPWLLSRFRAPRAAESALSKLSHSSRGASRLHRRSRAQRLLNDLVEIQSASESLKPYVPRGVRPQEGPRRSRETYVARLPPRWHRLSLSGTAKRRRERPRKPSSPQSERQTRRRGYWNNTRARVGLSRRIAKVRERLSNRICLA